MSNTENGHDNMDIDTENEAKTLFPNGTDSEREGNNFETTCQSTSNKEALKLGPDVEKKITDDETGTGVSDTDGNSHDNMDIDMENEAKTLFPNGTDSEREGNNFETTCQSTSNKEALKLGPDVEKKITNDETATGVSDTDGNSHDNMDIDMENEAKMLFPNGTDSEREGNNFETICQSTSNKEALKLGLDVEKKITDDETATGVSDTDGNSHDNMDIDTENEAKTLFPNGTHSEREGNNFETTCQSTSNKEALKLGHDVEKKITDDETATGVTDTDGNSHDNMDIDMENEAKTLFPNGTHSEREGNNFETTCQSTSNKEVIKLGPDVEKKITDDETSTPVKDTYENVESNENEDKYDNKEDLLLRLQRIMGSQICFPENSQQIAHFSALPPELVLYIFRWVVSKNLDLKTLEQCTAVCRGWYLCARDPEIWRRACSQFWTANINDLIPYNGSWRQMFIERPHILTYGCYICRVYYSKRRNPAEFRPAKGREITSTTYFRYFRFFSDGRVLMLLSYNTPDEIVHKIQPSEKAPFNVYPGHYRLSGNQLFVKVDKIRIREFNKRIGWKAYLLGGITERISYHMVFEISEYKSKHNWKLVGKDYEIINQMEEKKAIVTKYDLSKKNFPPYIFSPVQCYTNKSEHIL